MLCPPTKHLAILLSLLPLCRGHRTRGWVEGCPPSTSVHNSHSQPSRDLRWSESTEWEKGVQTTEDKSSWAHKGEPWPSIGAAGKNSRPWSGPESWHEVVSPQQQAWRGGQCGASKGRGGLSKPSETGSPWVPNLGFPQVPARSESSSFSPASNFGPQLLYGKLQLTIIAQHRFNYFQVAFLLKNLSRPVKNIYNEWTLCHIWLVWTVSRQIGVVACCGEVCGSSGTCPNTHSQALPQTH